MASQLSNLASELKECYECTGDIQDLEQAIEHQQEAVNLVPTNDPDIDIVAYLFDLAALQQMAYDRTGEMHYLNQAIAHRQWALTLIPSDSPNMPALLNLFGCSLQDRYRRTGEMEDLQQAIELQQRAVALTPDGDPRMPSRLNNLGSSLQKRYMRTGEMSDLIETIAHQQRAVVLATSDNPDMSTCLSNLSISLRIRYDRTGVLQDLQQAIEYQQQLITLTSINRSALSGFLGNLGNSLQARYTRTGNMHDLDQAIAYQQRAISLTPSDEPIMPTHFNNLGISYHIRHDRTAELSDLDSAIAHQQRAVALTPSDHPDLSRWLISLGNSLQKRYRRTGDLQNLDQAIAYQQQAVTLTPDDDPVLPGRLNNLGLSLQIRYDRTEEMQNLDEAIVHQQRAVALMPSDHPDIPALLNNLGGSLQTRYDCTGVLQDLDQAIVYLQQAVTLTPNDRPLLPDLLNDFASSLHTRYQRLKAPENLDQAISVLKRTIASPYGSISTKYIAAVRWADYARSAPDCTPASCITAYTEAIGLLPRLTWLGQSLPTRQQLLSRVRQGVVGDAAACAIELSDLPLAIELLEQGRSILWGQLLQFRTELIDIRAVEPDLGDELYLVGQMVERSTFDAFAHPNDEEAVQKHHRLAERWEQLVDRVRRIPGLENFLRRTPFSELQKAASAEGPVVVVNVSRHRCDALIITHDGPIQLVPLPELHLEDVGARAQAFREAVTAWNENTIGDREFEQEHLYPTLRYLWAAVVQPVVDDGLGYMDVKLDPRPRMWWCPTGPLTFLPLHAAGPYKSGPDLIQRVVCSYTSTLAALARARSRRRPRSAKDGDDDEVKMVAIGVVSTPYERRLHDLENTSIEIDAVVDSARRHAIPAQKVEGASAGVENVISLLRECNTSNIVHLACHARQDHTVPMESAVYLGDGCLSLARIASLRLADAEFAFLSACHSAGGSGALPDEAMHIAAGMQVAGYRSVVATMWSMLDWVGPEMVGMFYDQVFTFQNVGGASFSLGAASAAALRDAVLALRVRKDEHERRIPAAAWANFIHIGI